MTNKRKNSQPTMFKMVFTAILCALILLMTFTGIGYIPIGPLKLTFNVVPVAIGAVIALGNLVLEKPTQQKFGKFKAIVTVYGLILGTMAGTALMAYIKTKQPAFLVYTIGAVFFLLSDLILSPMYFGEGKNTPVNFVLNHTTYYVGQYMIAFSTFLLAANA